MVPTGFDPKCTGARPIVLYAHGTSTDRAFHIASVQGSDNSEGLFLAAFFAAQGYIVVAPNYAATTRRRLAIAVSRRRSGVQGHDRRAEGGAQCAAGLRPPC